MGLSCRRFLVARDDTLGRLANTAFDRMLRDPASWCLPVFGGQRVRMADVIVELVAREPVRVVRRTFAMLAFDDEGCIDTARFDLHQVALAEAALRPLFAARDRKETVIDAANRFMAQGGSWAPSGTLGRAIDDAALGRLWCSPLTCVSRRIRKANEP